MFYKGCFVQTICFLIGFSLVAKGCQNYKIAMENEEIHEITLKELVTTPQERAKWVEVRGVSISGSYINEGKVGYVLFVDIETKMAIFDKVAKNSSLFNQTTETVILQGMSRPFEKAASLPKKNIPAEVKVANLVIAENEKPPGGWSTWGLWILGFFIIEIPFNYKRSS